MTLYEIADDYLKLLDMADSMEPDEEQTFLDTLEGVKGEITKKTDSYCAVITEINANIDKFDAEIKRLTARKQAMENHVKRMKEALLEAMKTCDLPEITGEHFKLKIQNNGGKRKLNVFGEVPDNYKRIVYEDDTDKIRKDLEDGKELPFAFLEERGQHVRFR